MIQFCYHRPSMKSWLTSTDLGSRGYLAKSVRSKSFLRKLHLKINPPSFSVMTISRLTSSNFLNARGAMPSQFRKSFKKMVFENSVPRTFLFSFFSIKMRVLIIWKLENLRLTKYEEKAWLKEKTENVINGLCMLVINYQ